MKCKVISGNVAPHVVLSFGLGRLHFVQAAQALSSHGIELTVHQGWVPGSRFNNRTLDLIGNMLGSPHLSVGMRRRRLEFLPPERNVSLTWAEIYAQAMLQASRRLGVPRGRAALAGWKAFGRASAARLGTAAQIFHVRSGAGYRSIRRARDLGMSVLTDHSIAHPAFMARHLKPEFEAAGLPFWTGPEDPFWRQVIADAEAADILLVNSDFVKETFVAEGLPPGKIAVVYLGVRNDFSGLKRDYGTGPRLELLFTGQFGTRKGARVLIAALERLAESGRDFHLTVLGDASEARDLVAASPIARRVSLPGFVPQDALGRYLERSDLYVFPSLAEGCASSAMEALTAGLPVIATRETGLPAQHGRQAWIVPPKDPDALAEAIATLADDAPLREGLGRAAAEMMAQGYTWDDYGRHVAALYERMLDGRIAAP